MNLFIFTNLLLLLLSLALNLVLSHPQRHYGKSLGESSFVNLADVPCGKTQIAIKDQRSPRIIGGSPVLPGEFPWSVSIQDEMGVHFCGGFVVNKQFIVTAAHCFIYYKFNLTSIETLKAMRIVLGATDLLKINKADDATSSVQTLRIHEPILHPNFSHLYPDFENDIAVIKLDEEIKWNTKVQPVCLLQAGDNGPDDFKRYNQAEVAGWGKRMENQSQKEWMKELMLQKVNLPLWKNNDCEKAYKNIEIDWNVKDSHICAGYPDPDGRRRDSCKGDSGSALLTKNPLDNIWTAAGVVSGGEGCAKEGIPGIYTRVSHFVPWIMSEISKSTV